jgi:hypothetical protein
MAGKVRQAAVGKRQMAGKVRQAAGKVRRSAGEVRQAAAEVGQAAAEVGHRRRAERECGSQKCSTADDNGGRKYKDRLTQHNKLLFPLAETKASFLHVMPEGGNALCGFRPPGWFWFCSACVEACADYDQMVITTIMSIKFT